MIPVFASDILKFGADGFGLLNAASDIGSMMIIVTLSFIPLRKNQGKILTGVVASSWFVHYWFLTVKTILAVFHIPNA